MQRSKRIRSLAAAFWALVVSPLPALAAGAVYVPLVGNPVDGFDWDARVAVANRGKVVRTVKSLILPLGTDGTQGAASARAANDVGAGRTILLDVSDSASGLLELTGAPQLLFSAWLVPAGDPSPVAVNLPIISSENAVAAGQHIYLQGWVRAGARVTDISLVNLGHAAGACTVSYFRADGSALNQAATVGLPPLSHRLFKDVLLLLGAAQASDVRADVTCDQPFFAFATVRDQIGGELTFIGPSTLSENGLDEVGDGGGGGPVPCPPDAFKCFSLPGTFFAATKKGTHRETFEMPTGAYNRVHLRFEVFHGGWQKPSDGLHSFFWLAIDRHYRLLGMASARGPGSNSMLFRHGVNIKAGDKPKFTPHFVAIPGHTYINDYVYDTKARQLVYNVYDKENPNVAVLTITDKPNVNQIHVEDGEDFVADFSSMGDHPNEPAEIGWKYMNLTLQVFE